MGCAFCASGLNGLIRNLKAEEILGEVVAANAYIGGGLGDKRKIINVVLMGSGEPLDNYEEVVRFLRLLASEEGLNVSPRNVSLSTSGLVPKIYDLAKEGLPVNLTVSLHAAFDDERKKIMPVAKRYSIAEILEACSYYFDKTGRRYIFEYVLIKGENDDARHAEGLIKLLRGRPCHVNLIRLNEVKERTLKGGTEKEAYRFLGLLVKSGLSATLRRKMGEDIEGACGQLRRRYLEEAEESKNLENAEEIVTAEEIKAAKNNKEQTEHKKAKDNTTAQWNTTAKKNKTAKAAADEKTFDKTKKYNNGRIITGDKTCAE